MRLKSCLKGLCVLALVSGIFIFFSCKQAIPVTSIDVYATDGIYEVMPGDHVLCYTEIFPSNADNKNVYWSVDNEACAYIDQDGVFTALEFIPDEEYGGICYVQVTARAADGSGVYGTYLFEIVEEYTDYDNWDENYPDYQNDYSQFGTGNFRSINSLPLYPEIDADSVFTDGEFFITFDSDDISLEEDGFILICDEDDIVVDKINFNEEVQTVWPKTGVEVFVKDQLVYKKNNVLYFQPHYGCLAPSTKYFIKIPTGAVKGERGGEAFTGMGDSWEWAFKTKYESSLDTVITVNNSIKTTRQNFRTVGGALRALAEGSPSQNYTIKVAAGEYHELVYADLRSNVTIEGEDSSEYGRQTLIWYNNDEEANPDEDCASVFYAKTKKNLLLKNIKIENRQNQTNNNSIKSPAFMIENDGGFFAAGNSSFSSLYGSVVLNVKSWLYSCFLEGNTSVLSGNADVVLLEKCQVNALLNNGNAKLFEAMTGNSERLSEGIGKGIVLFDSEITADQNGSSVYFAHSSAQANMKECFDQVALIDVKLRESCWSKMAVTQWDYSILPLYQKKDREGNMNAGWKSYGLKTISVTAGQEYAADYPSENNSPYSGTICAELYAHEYNGRRSILNRLYYTFEERDDSQNTILYGSYKFSDNVITEANLAELEEYFAATEDNSKNNTYSDNSAYIISQTSEPPVNPDDDNTIDGISLSLAENAGIGIVWQADGKLLNFTASDGFENYSWLLDGVYKSSEIEYTLDTQLLSSGTHVLVLSAENLNASGALATSYIIITVNEPDPAEDGGDEETGESLLTITTDLLQNQILVGDRVNLSALYLSEEENYDDVTWSLSNTEYAVLSELSGQKTVLTAKKAGSVTVTALSGENSASKTYTIKALADGWIWRADDYTGNDHRNFQSTSITVGTSPASLDISNGYKFQTKNEKICEGYTFSRCVQMNKNGSSSDKCASFNVTGNAVITIYGMSSGSDGASKFTLSSSRGELVSYDLPGSTALSALKYSYTGEDTTLYIFCSSQSKTANLFGVRVEY